MSTEDFERDEVQGYARGYAEGYERGFAKGSDEGYEQGQAERDGFTEALQLDIVEALSEKYWSSSVVAIEEVVQFLKQHSGESAFLKDKTKEIFKFYFGEDL